MGNDDAIDSIARAHHLQGSQPHLFFTPKEPRECLGLTFLSQRVSAYYLAKFTIYFFELLKRNKAQIKGLQIQPQYFSKGYQFCGQVILDSKWSVFNRFMTSKIKDSYFSNKAFVTNLLRYSAKDFYFWLLKYTNQNLHVAFNLYAAPHFFLHKLTHEITVVSLLREWDVFVRAQNKKQDPQITYQALSWPAV